MFAPLGRGRGAKRFAGFEQQRACPAPRWIAMRAFMPRGGLGEARNFQRRGQHGETFGALREPLRDHGDQIACAQDFGQHEKTRDRERDAARAAMLRERFVGDAVKAAARVRHQGVIERAETRERDASARGVGMIGAHHADVAFVEQTPRVQIGGRALGRDERHVDVAARQLRMQRRVLHRHHGHANARRFATQHREIRRDHGLQRIVGGGEREREVGARGIEGLRREQRFHFAENLLERRDEFERAQRRRDAALRADEEGIVEGFAQAHEHAAHGGLRERETARGARDVAFVEQGVERAQQVQVDCPDIGRHDFRLRKSSK
ncbi:hypothetical protein PT2222_70269 [Paraburkholderia tropica]